MMWRNMGFKVTIPFKIYITITYQKIYFPIDRLPSLNQMCLKGFEKKFFQNGLVKSIFNPLRNKTYSHYHTTLVLFIHIILVLLDLLMQIFLKIYM